MMVWDKDWVFVDSTGASVSVFASVVAILNDRLISSGKPPLGFLNPFLYSTNGMAALNDTDAG